jgi:hypothetical protein
MVKSLANFLRRWPPLEWLLDRIEDQFAIPHDDDFGPGFEPLPSPPRVSMAPTTFERRFMAPRRSRSTDMGHAGGGRSARVGRA